MKSQVSPANMPPGTVLAPNWCSQSLYFLSWFLVFSIMISEVLRSCKGVFTYSTWCSMAGFSHNPQSPINQTATIWSVLSTVSSHAQIMLKWCCILLRLVTFLPSDPVCASALAALYKYEGLFVMCNNMCNIVGWSRLANSDFPPDENWVKQGLRSYNSSPIRWGKIVCSRSVK